MQASHVDERRLRAWSWWRSRGCRTCSGRSAELHHHQRYCGQEKKSACQDAPSPERHVEALGGYTSSQPPLTSVLALLLRTT